MRRRSASRTHPRHARRAAGRATPAAPGPQRMLRSADLHAPAPGALCCRTTRRIEDVVAVTHREHWQGKFPACLSSNCRPSASRTSRRRESKPTWKFRSSCLGAATPRTRRPPAAPSGSTPRASRTCWPPSRPARQGWSVGRKMTPLPNGQHTSAGPAATPASRENPSRDRPRGAPPPSSALPLPRCPAATHTHMQSLHARVHQTRFWGQLCNSGPHEVDRQVS